MFLTGNAGISRALKMVLLLLLGSPDNALFHVLHGGPGDNAHFSDLAFLHGLHTSRLNVSPTLNYLLDTEKNVRRISHQILARYTPSFLKGVPIILNTQIFNF